MCCAKSSTFFFSEEKWVSSRAEHKTLSASTQQSVPSARLHLAREIIEVFCLPGWMSIQFKINTCTFEFSCKNTCQYNYRFTFCKYTGKAAWLWKTHEIVHVYLKTSAIKYEGKPSAEYLLCLFASIIFCSKGLCMLVILWKNISFTLILGETK